MKSNQTVIKEPPQLFLSSKSSGSPQEAILKLSTFRGEAALFTWLCTFCRHEISGYFQKENRAPQKLHLTMLKEKFRGSSSGVRPDQVPDLVLPTYGLKPLRQGGILRIEPR